MRSSFSIFPILKVFWFPEEKGRHLQDLKVAELNYVMMKQRRTISPFILW